jgi:hypothetical protein
MSLRAHRAVLKRLDIIMAKRVAEKEAAQGFPPILGAWSLYPMPDDEANRAEVLFYTLDQTEEQEQELQTIFTSWPEAEGKLKEHMPTRKGAYMRFSYHDWLL